MTYEYISNYEDFLAAQRLNRRGSRWRQTSFVFFLWIVPAVSFLVFVLLLRDVMFDNFSFPAWMGGTLSALVALGVYFPIAYQLQLRKLYKQMKNGRPEGVPVEFELTADEVISRVPGVSEGRFRKPSLFGFLEDEHVAMLYVTKKRFLLLPKRMMPEAGWAELRSWLGPIAAGRP